MAAASSEPSAEGPARRLGLLYSAIACLVVFVGAAWWSWRYAPLPDPFEPAESRTFWQWLTTPIEENAFRRLPVVTGDLHSVFALKGTEHVWAVGPGGMILHSADGGESWEQQSDIDWSPTVPKETEPAAENDAFGLIRSARANGRAASPPPAETAEVQRLLGDLGYDPGPADGQPGAKTRAAIEQFQRDASLPVDGMLTEAVREQLAKALDSRRTNLPVSPPPGGNPGPVPGPGPNPGPGPGPLANPNPNPDSRPQANPTPSPARNPVALSAVAFADERLGVAVGENGVVLRTTDGGRRWQAAKSGTKETLQAITFVNGGRVVAVSSNRVLRSADGGKTWENETVPDVSALYDVASGPDAQTVAVGMSGTILHSPDGGKSWETVTSPTRTYLHDIAFGLDGKAVAVGSDGTVLHSADGGRTWEKVVSPTDKSLFGVALGPNGEAMAVGWGGTVLRSAGEGRAWEIGIAPIDVPLYDVALGPNGQAVAVGQSGTILHSSDEGRTWESATAPTGGSLQDIEFGSDGQAVAVSWDTVLHSPDGGKTWEGRIAPGAAVLYGVALGPNGQAVAVGFKGAVLRSGNGGKSWKSASAPTDKVLEDVAFGPNGQAVAVGGNGTILRSSDGGKTWETATAPTDKWLDGVAFGPDGQVVAVGTEGVFRSPDAGRTWETVVSTTEASLNGVALGPHGQGVAVGSDGTVLRSSDGGNTWEKETGPTSAELTRVALGPEGQAVALATEGTIWRSPNGGKTWDTEPVYTGTRLRDVAFDFGGQAVAVGDAGIVLHSADGGKTWELVEYRRYPPRLFLALSGAALLFGLVGARRAWREVPVERRTVSVTDLFASDRPLRPGERDALDLGAIARGISRFLRNRQTEPPLTIAVTGEWGSGKSSLMGLLYEDLRGRGFRPVWFNAWHHQRGEHLLASLYANIRAQALPPAWAPEGFGFRWDLFWIRARRHWLWLLLTVPLVSLVFGYLFLHPASGKGLIDLALKDSDEWEKIGKTTLLSGGLLAALAPPLVGLYNAVRAFGLEPKRLLGSLAVDAGGAVKAEPGVRYRFAAEFADVTKALKPQTLVIFIDDLDRCTQEHVLEVLECINFLVTAGDCYIVLGMSRRWVETCVGLAFKELAAEAPDEAGGSNDATAVPVPPGQQASPSLLPADDPRDERRRFARQYLEKLVNIEVPIPRVGDAAAASLLAPPLPEEPTRCVRAARWLHTKASEWWLPVVLVGVFAGAIWLATELPDMPKTESKATGDGSIPDRHAKQEVPPDEKNKTDDGSSVPKAKLVSGERGGFSPGARDDRARIYHWGSAGVATLALLTLIGVLLGRRGRVQTDDSEDFRAALEVMRPWIVLGHPTPRLLKRYLNHVRFVAMRQRGDEEPESLAGSLLGRLGLVPKPPEPLAPPAGLAEPVLVALSALHQSRLDWQIEPEWLADDYANLKDGGISALVETRLEDTAGRAELLVRLKKALDDYNQRFPAYCLFADEQRDRQAIWTLLEAMAGVRIDGKVEAPITATPVGDPAAAAPA